MKIKEEWIKEAIAKEACKEAIEWLRNKPRTCEQLAKYRRDWAVWAMLHITNYPINLTGLNNADRAQVMAKRSDCPIDLIGFNKVDRDWVKANRTECWE